MAGAARVLGFVRADVAGIDYARQASTSRHNRREKIPMTPLVA
jgi:hypothetical protein